MKLRIFILSIFISLNAFATGKLPGLILLEYGARPASDLVYKDKVLFPEEAHRLYEESGGTFDLSLLNPASSDIWSDEFPEKLTQDEINLNYQDSVEYLSGIPSRLGNFRFSVQDSDSNQFTIMTSKTIHNVLIRSALLRKIGYRVPPIKYISKLKVNFENTSRKNVFKTLLNEQTLGDPKRWIAHEEDTSLILQDMVVMLPDSKIYNFALGNDLGEILLGRRALSSLVIPFSICQIPESVNLLNWSTGRIVSNHALLELDKSLEFSASYDDAKWITRRILKLTETDWKEIVDSSHLPETVKVITLEKLKARRNSIARTLKMDFQELPIIENPSNGEVLLEGKLTQQFFDGYARRFAYGDPENPLSSSEMTNYIKSKALSTAIDAAVSAVNNLDFLSTDIAGRNQEELQNLIEQATSASIENNNTVTDIPVSTWIYPTFSGGIRLSRNIITGNYLGTDNLIQLVDNIGVNVSAGAFLGVGGLGSNVLPVSGGVSGNAYYIRNYSHIKPLFSVEQALKYPFKNMVVPMFKRDIGKKLAAFKDIDQIDEINDEQVLEVLEKFKESLAPKESLLVTDSVGASLQAIAGIQPTLLGQVVRIDAGMSTSANIISRTHIYRKDAETIQIYKDFGNINSVEISLNLSAGIPVIRTSMRFSKGTARTKFYNVSLDANQNNIRSLLRALRSVFMSNSVEALESELKPFVLRHKFNESEKRAGIFFIKLNKTNSSNHITLTTPNGEKREMYRRYEGSVSGSDYEAYAFDVVTAITKKLLKADFSTTSSGGGNPGYSFLGKAKNKVMSFEAIKDKNGVYSKPFVKLSRIWNGWSLKKRKLKRILKEIKDKYIFNYHAPQVAAQTDKLYLYNINVNFLIYEAGIKHMMTLDTNMINTIFNAYATKRPSTYNRTRTRISSTYPSRKFKKHVDDMKKALKDNDIDKYSKKALDAIAIAEDNLNVYGLREILGGEKNFYSFSRIDGFREGDEGADVTGEQGIISHAIGEFGEQGMKGPLEETRSRLKMTEGEFLINWIMKRVI